MSPGTLDNKIARNEFLCTTRTYGDFELRLKVKLLGGDNANAGIQFRTKRIPNHHEVTGYQADMGVGWWGALYDESRRNKVLTGPDQAKMKGVVKAGEWNDYVIRAEGKRIQLWINGFQTVDYTEEDPADRRDRRHRRADPQRPAEPGVVQGHHDREPHEVDHDRSYSRSPRAFDASAHTRFLRDIENTPAALIGAVLLAFQAPQFPPLGTGVSPEEKATLQAAVDRAVGQGRRAQTPVPDRPDGGSRRGCRDLPRRRPTSAEVRRAACTPAAGARRSQSLPRRLRPAACAPSNWPTARRRG